MVSLFQFKTFGKRKRRNQWGDDEDVEEELPSAKIPERFKAFVHDAIDKFNRKQDLRSVPSETRLHKWSNADGDDFHYSLNVGDVRLLDTFLEKQKYTLAVADVPYGFNVPGSEFDDVPFSKQDLVEMITKFAACTTSPIWRFVIVHSLQQVNDVLAALSETCNCGVEAGIWEKPNINSQPHGNRLAWGFENWSIGYFSSDSVRHKEMYQFDKYESRINIVKSSCVTKKSLDPLGAIVNPYQKPVALGDWFVKHFSEEGDWVADLCCGTGSTLVAALLNHRHGCAVDKSKRQIDEVTRRIMTLESDFSLAAEAAESGEGARGAEVQPPVKGQLGTLSTHQVVISEEVEVEVENKDSDKPASPTSEEKNKNLNNMLKDL